MQHHSQDGAPARSMVTESQVLTGKCSGDAVRVVLLACSLPGKQAVPSFRRGISPAETRSGGSARPHEPAGTAPSPPCGTCPNEGLQAIFRASESRLGAKKCALCADETLKQRVRERKTQVWTHNDEEEEFPFIH